MVKENPRIRSLATPSQIRPPISPKAKTAIVQERTRRAVATAQRKDQREATRFKQNVQSQFKSALEQYKNRIENLKLRVARGDDEAENQLSANERAYQEIKSRAEGYENLKIDENYQDILSYGSDYGSKVLNYANEVRSYYENRAEANRQRRQIQQRLEKDPNVALVYEKGRWTGSVISKTSLPQQLLSKISQSKIELKDIKNYNSRTAPLENVQQTRIQSTSGELRLGQSFDPNQSIENLRRAGLTDSEIGELKNQSIPGKTAGDRAIDFSERYSRGKEKFFGKVGEKISEGLDKAGLQLTASITSPLGFGVGAGGFGVEPKVTDSSGQRLNQSQLRNLFQNIPTNTAITLKTNINTINSQSSQEQIKNLEQSDISKSTVSKFKKFLRGEKVTFTPGEQSKIIASGVEIGTYFIPFVGGTLFTADLFGGAPGAAAKTKDYIKEAVSQPGGYKNLPKEVKKDVKDFFTQQSLIDDVDKQIIELQNAKITDTSVEYENPTTKEKIDPYNYNAEINNSIQELQGFKQNILEGRGLRGALIGAGAVAALALGGKAIKGGMAARKAEAELLNYAEAKKQFDELKKIASVVKREQRGEVAIGELVKGQVSLYEQKRIFNDLKKLGVDAKTAQDIDNLTVYLGKEVVISEVPVMKKIKVPSNLKLSKKLDNLYTVYTKPVVTHVNKLYVYVRDEKGITKGYVFVFPTKKPLGNFRDINSALKYATNKRLVAVTSTPNNKIFISKEYKLLGDRALEQGTFLSGVKVYGNEKGESVIIDTRKLTRAAPYASSLEEAYAISPRVSRTAQKTQKTAPTQVRDTLESDFLEIANAMEKNTITFEGTRTRASSVGRTKVESVVLDSGYVLTAFKRQAEELKKIPKSRLRESEKTIINLVDKAESAAKKGKNIKVNSEVIQKLDEPTQMGLVSVQTLTPRTRAPPKPKVKTQQQDYWGFESMAAAQSLGGRSAQSNVSSTSQKSSQLNRQKLKSSVQQRDQVDVLIAQMEGLAQSQAQAPRQAQVTKQKTKTAQLNQFAPFILLDTPIRVPRTARPGQPPRVPGTPLRFPSRKEKGKNKVKTAEEFWGFETEVRRKGKFKVVGETFATEEEALGFGFSNVDVTLARTTRIRKVKTKKKPKPTSFASDFEKLGKNFYAKREKGRTVFIEKASKALSRKGEIREIQKARREKSAEQFWFG